MEPPPAQEPNGQPSEEPPVVTTTNNKRPRLEEEPAQQEEPVGNDDTGPPPPQAPPPPPESYSEFWGDDKHRRYTPEQQQHRAEQRDASIGRLAFGVQREVSELFARVPRLRDELEPCCFDSLGDFDEPTGREIVAKFGSRDLAGVRSVTAYFCGLLKRYRADGPYHATVPPQQQRRHRAPLQMVEYADFPQATKFFAQPPTRPQQQQRGLQHVAHTAEGLAEQASSIASLAPAVRDAIEDIFRLDGVRRIEMEPCCFESLRDFAEPVALRIVRDFRNADMRTLRDKTAFFCSILKRYRAHAAQHGKIFGRSAQIALGRGPGSAAEHLRSAEHLRFQQHHSLAHYHRDNDAATQQRGNVVTPSRANQRNSPLNPDSAVDSPWGRSRNFVYEDPYSWPYPVAYHPGIVPAPPAYYNGQHSSPAGWGYMS